MSNEDDKKDEADDGRIWLKCKEPNCRRDFYMKPAELAFFRESNYNLPTRCFGCRAWRRALKEKEGK